ncbi:MAG TPA: GNAT family N-acetyltransferase [Mycobacteriales bacterium]|jgi:Acetyltransferases
MLELRRRTSDDMSACICVLAEVHEADHYPANWPTHPGRWLTPDGLLEAWVAVSGSTIVGHVVLQGGACVEPSLTRAVDVLPDRLASVSRLFVAPSVRGHGVATKLLAAAGRYASVRGLRLTLDVAENCTAAIRLYEQAGWKRTVSTPVEWLMTNGEPALVHHYLSPPNPTPFPQDGLGGDHQGH